MVVAPILGKPGRHKRLRCNPYALADESYDIAMSKESVGDGRVYSSNPGWREMASLFGLGHRKGARPEDWDVEKEGAEERRDKAEVAESCLATRVVASRVVQPSGG